MASRRLHPEHEVDGAEDTSRESAPGRPVWVTVTLVLLVLGLLALVLINVTGGHTPQFSH